MRTDSLTEDVDALLQYAAESDLLTATEPEATDTLRRNLLQPLADALSSYRMATDENYDTRKIDLLFYYSALNKLTGNVSGRSYRDSVSGTLYGLVFFTACLIGVTIAYEGASVISANGNKALIFLQREQYLRPLLWGALGSCIYLLKYLADKMSGFEFDKRCLSGLGTRIALGAIMGMVVVKVFTMPDNLSASAAAFLTGLGVKAIYRALESTVEALAERLDFKSLKRDPATPPALAGAAMPEATAGARPDDESPTWSQPPNDSDLKSNIRVSRVNVLQSRLAGRGFDPGPIDGIMGPKTIAAIAAYLGDATFNEITEYFKDQDRLVGLAELLLHNEPPGKWRERVEALAKTSPLLVLGADATQKEREILHIAIDLLKKHQFVDADATAGSVTELQNLAERGFEAFARVKPEVEAMSFTEALDELRKRPPAG